MPSYSGEPQEKKFYVYIHSKPDGTPFYVGKGHGIRANKFSIRNPHHKNIVAKYGKDAIIIGKLDCATEQIAFETEKWLIAFLKSMGFELTNRTLGGEGSTGLVMSPEARAQISASLMGRKGTPHTPESKAKISAAKKGKKRTPEQRLKLCRKNTTVTAETREKLRAAAYVFWAKRKQMLGERDAVV